MAGAVGNGSLRTASSDRHRPERRFRDRIAGIRSLGIGAVRFLHRPGRQPGRRSPDGTVSIGSLGFALSGSAFSGSAPSGTALPGPVLSGTHCRDRRSGTGAVGGFRGVGVAGSRESPAGSCFDSTADPTDAASASTRSRASVSSSASALAARMNQVSASASRPARSSRSA